MAERFRSALETLEARRLPQIFTGEPHHPVHGDFAPWNLLERGGALSGLLDFEIGHVDVLVADIALARRGYHDAVVEGYLEVRPLPDEQLAALDGLWLACLFYGLWSAIEGWERDGVDRPEQLDWNLEQLGKTRPPSLTPVTRSARGPPAPRRACRPAPRRTPGTRRRRSARRR